MNSAEERVSKFYNTVGWETKENITEDAKRFEDLRDHAKEYVSKCRLRVLRHIPDHGVNILDMASGPIQYKEYLEYSRNFKSRHCGDLSLEALKQAKKKIGNHGVFVHGSFFEIPMEEHFFDCAISLHTIYHIDEQRQEEAVRKLVYVTKPGKPVIIVYSNPNTFVSFLKSPVHLLRRTRRLLGKLRAKENRIQKEDVSLYYHPHPIEWWNRFSDIATVKILPWRSFQSNHQKRLIPDNELGRKIHNVLFKLEERFPNFFVKHFQYPMIILTKRNG